MALRMLARAIHREGNATGIPLFCVFLSETELRVNHAIYDVLFHQEVLHIEAMLKSVSRKILQDYPLSVLILDGQNVTYDSVVAAPEPVEGRSAPVFRSQRIDRAV